MFDAKTNNQLITKANIYTEYTNGNILLIGAVPSDNTSNQIATKTYLTTNYKVDTGNIYIAGKSTNQLIAKRDVTPTTLVPYKFNDTVIGLTIEPSGSIIVGGLFTSYNYQTSKGLAKLNTNSVLNSTYNTNWGTTFNGNINRISLQSDGKAIVGGNFNSSAQRAFVRLNSDGTVDTSFNTGTGVTGSFSGGITTILIQSDSKIILTGDIQYYNSSPVGGIVRINSNGTKDSSFYTSLVVGGFINSAIQLSDNKYLVGGNFQSYQDYVGGIVYDSDRLLTLYSDGTVDKTFDWNNAFDGIVNHIIKQSDGKVLICGEFNNYFGYPKSKLVRLTYAYGIFERDDALNTGTGFNGKVFFAMQQSDGKLIICGDFTTYNGNSCNRIVRINLDGSIDTSFNIGTGFTRTSGYCAIYAVSQQSDGKLVVGGSFSHYNNVAKEHIVRLNTNGSIDNLF